MRWTIYRLVNENNGKVYVGQTTKTPEARLKEHCRGGHTCVLLDRAIKKYGAAAFRLQHLSVCDSQEEADLLEREWIREYRSNKAKRGYNLTAGGRGGHQTTCKRAGHDLTVPGSRVSESDGSCRICKVANAKLRLHSLPYEERNARFRRFREKLFADPERYAVYLEKKRRKRREQNNQTAA